MNKYSSARAAIGVCAGKAGVGIKLVWGGAGIRDEVSGGMGWSQTRVMGVGLGNENGDLVMLGV